MVTLVPAMLLVLGAGTGLAMATAGEGVPGAQGRAQRVQAARSHVEAERGELQAPRAAVREHGVVATRAQEVQAPRADSVQAPRGVAARSPHASGIMEPRWRED